MLSHKNARSIIIALLGFSAFSGADACSKWLMMQGYGAFQVIAIECALAIPLLALASPWLGGVRSVFTKTHWRLHGARGVLYVIAVSMIFYCFPRMSLAAFYTVIFITPMVTAAFAALIYREHLCIRRITAICGGFIGVIVSFRPDVESFNNPALLVGLATTVPLSLLQLAPRSMPKASPFALAIWPVLFAALAGGAISANDFVMPAVNYLPVFVLSAFCVATGITALAVAFRAAPAALVAPMTYSQMIWGILIGWFVFNDSVDMFMMVGAGVIIASGLYLIYAERHVPSQES